MKKNRTSNVQAYHGLILEEVSRKREELVRKFGPRNEQQVKGAPTSEQKLKSVIEKVKTTQKSTGQKVKKDGIEYIPLNVNRSDENMRQWGARVKIPVDEVKMLAMQLKASIKPRATKIRYQRPSDNRGRASWVSPDPAPTTR